MLPTVLCTKWPISLFHEHNDQKLQTTTSYILFQQTAGSRVLLQFWSLFIQIKSTNSHGGVYNQRGNLSGGFARALPLLLFSSKKASFEFSLSAALFFRALFCSMMMWKHFHHHIITVLLDLL